MPPCDWKVAGCLPAGISVKGLVLFWQATTPPAAEGETSRRNRHSEQAVPEIQHTFHCSRFFISVQGIFCLPVIVCLGTFRFSARIIQIPVVSWDDLMPTLKRLAFSKGTHCASPPAGEWLLYRCGFRRDCPEHLESFWLPSIARPGGRSSSPCCAAPSRQLS